MERETQNLGARLPRDQRSARGGRLTDRPIGPGVSGRRVLATLGLILLATAVVPPLGAYAVNHSRVRAATRVVSNLADGLRADPSRLVEMARSADVACGSGHTPLARLPGAQGWVTAPRAAWVQSGREDPWGNCYAVNLAAANRPGAAVWALSAGPDGIIDTPFISSSDAPVRDDVRMRIR